MRLQLISDGTVLLQWGHGDEAVEEVHRATSGDAPAGLQWGHGDEAVEEGLPRVARLREPIASMGPRR